MEHPYTCPHTGAKLTVLRADMDRLRELIGQLKKKRPPPEPPIVEVKTFESETQGLPPEKIPNLDDEEYKKAKLAHDTMVYSFAQNVFWRTALVLDTEDRLLEFHKLIADGQARVDLFNYIQSVSEITQKAVEEAKKRLGYSWQGKPLWHIPAKTTPGGISLQEVAYGAAASLYNMTPRQVDQIPYPDQAEMIARYSLSNQLARLETEWMREQNKPKDLPQQGNRTAARRPRRRR